MQGTFENVAAMSARVSAGHFRHAQSLKEGQKPLVRYSRMTDLIGDEHYKIPDRRIDGDLFAESSKFGITSTQAQWKVSFITSCGPQSRQQWPMLVTSKLARRFALDRKSCQR